jgi:hypothetical protein
MCRAGRMAQSRRRGEDGQSDPEGEIEMLAVHHRDNRCSAGTIGWRSTFVTGPLL